MRKHFLFALLALATLFVGCRKDPDEPPTNGSGKLLKRVIEVEDGVTTTYNLSYDGSKRLTSIRTTDNSEVTDFTYNSNGDIVKIENKVDDTRNIYEFTYNNGVPATGNFKSYDLEESEQGTLTTSYDLAYTVSNGLVTLIRMSMDDGEGGSTEMDFNLSYTNGNLTKVESAGVNVYTATFTYGNKKPIFPAIFKYVMDQAGFSMQFFAKNEILTMAYDFPGTTNDVSVSNQYTYDADGYVLTSNDGETQTRYEYE